MVIPAPYLPGAQDFTMPYDVAIRSAALALIAQYGDDAEVIAMLRAAEFAAAGDVDGLAQWDDILGCLARLGGTTPDRLSLN